MKKFLIAAAASLLLFGGQADVEAATIEAVDLDLQSVETREMGHWANFRDEVILGRESDRERRKRKEWERRHRHELPPPPRPLPPPPRYGSPPPPPPRYGHPPTHHGQLPPPPPPRMR